jgi:predicted DNA binding CopG/RHH family protein
MAKKNTKKVAEPPTPALQDDDGRDSHIIVRVGEWEKVEFRDKAKKRGLDLSSWIRMTLHDAH